MDVTRIRKDFPTYQSENGDVIYMDSACQTLRPRKVMEAMARYYELFPACGGRSIHRFATQVSIEIDEARDKAARFLGASTPEEIVFTKSCTEALNLVARGLSLRKGDVILTTDIEHNSNHVPWLCLQREKGVRRRFVRTPPSEIFDIEEFKKAMDREVKVVSMVHTNNITGTSIPVKDVAEIAHDYGAVVIFDGAQAASHQPLDMKRIGADFYAISAHKMLGPSGMGLLYGRLELLKDLKPLITGGGAVSLTTYEHADLLPPPDRFEAGLQNYSGIIGTGAAIDYLTHLGLEEVNEHVQSLNARVTSLLSDCPGLSILGPKNPKLRGSIFSFNIKGMNSHDVAIILDEVGKVMIRSGMHCAHPYFIIRKMEGCARASFYIYNDEKEIQRFAEIIKELGSKFSE
ncbi:MAG: aminotransferase class V-fold PLP-dependent enzyme [Methanomassiliicoccales archaeon]